MKIEASGSIQSIKAAPVKGGAKATYTVAVPRLPEEAAELLPELFGRGVLLVREALMDGVPYLCDSAVMQGGSLTLRLSHELVRPRLQLSGNESPEKRDELNDAHAGRLSAWEERCEAHGGAVAQLLAGESAPVTVALSVGEIRQPELFNG